MAELKTAQSKMARWKERTRAAGVELYRWLDHRLGLTKPIVEAAEHNTPSNNASWWYVFGSAATVLLMMQVVTGVLLALVYTPSASEAWSSLNFINNNITLGWYLRALHGWGSDFMIAIVLIHMAQVFLFGAYKFPREFTWIVGVFLLLLTLGMAFTGQVLRFDQDSYWGLGIGASIVSRDPCLGRVPRPHHAGRPNHRRHHADPLLRAPCLCHPRHSPRRGRFACLDGPAPRRQRMAHARPPGSQVDI